MLKKPFSLSVNVAFHKLIRSSKRGFLWYGLHRSKILFDPFLVKRIMDWDSSGILIFFFGQFSKMVIESEGLQFQIQESLNYLFPDLLSASKRQH